MHQPIDPVDHVVLDAATWAHAYARRTMRRPPAVRCGCATLHAWQAASHWRTCRRGCDRGWRLP